MKWIRSFLLFAAIPCGLGACSARVEPGYDSNGGGSAGLLGGGRSGEGGEQGPFTLSSPVFADNGPLGGQYQCGASGVSPPLSWTAGPASTQSYAVVMVGPASSGVGSLYHWVIWDIPATTTSLPEAVAQLAKPEVPAGSSQISTNADGATWPGYSGPCSMLPAAYTFTVYALEVRTLPGVTPTSTGAAVFAAIQANTAASAPLTAMASHYRS